MKPEKQYINKSSSLKKNRNLNNEKYHDLTETCK